MLLIIEATIPGYQSNFGLELRLRIILFYIRYPSSGRFVVGLFHVIHGTTVASHGGRRNTTKGFPVPDVHKALLIDDNDGGGE